MTVPSTEWKEIIPAGESERIEAAARALNELQRRRAARRGDPVPRALHAKAHAGFEAELSTLGDLPEHARAGIFAAPSTYRAYVRFSSGDGRRRRDATPDVRALALKVVGVPGTKLIPGLADARTQDFLANHHRTTMFRDAEEFAWWVVAGDSPATVLPKALLRWGPLRTFQVIRKLQRTLGQPIASVATTTYHGTLPVQWGRHAARYGFVPRAKDAPAPSTARDRLGEEIRARLAREPVEFDMTAQFFVDEQRTPIEDPSRDWLDADSPPLVVARLTLPRQDAASPRGLRVAELCESFSFDPWHAPVDFRPLGHLMRARNAAYRLSTIERKAAPEPDGTEQLPP